MTRKKVAKKRPSKERKKKGEGKLATRVSRSQLKAVSKPRAGAVRMDARLKGLTVAVEPPIDANPADLLPVFLAKLDASLTTLRNAGTPFKLVEGFRTVERQQWLFGSGRPNAQPFGRPGPILTNADGVTKRSKHQGTGAPGSGVAADCYPTRNGNVYIPPSSDPIWNAYAAAVVAQGLVAGHNWPTFKDSPHCEEP
jgi:hypothetical protein